MLAISVIKAIAIMMEAASSSETSVGSYQTVRHNVAEDSHLHTRLHKTRTPPVCASVAGCHLAELHILMRANSMAQTRV
jgi:hypothetical protein